VVYNSILMVILYSMEKFRYKKLILISILAISIILPGCKISEKDRPKALNRFAMKCVNNEVFKEAEYRLTQAIEINPNDADLHNNLAIVLEAQGKLKESFAEYRQALSLDPSNVVILKNIEEFKKIHKNEIED